ncbi:MAG: tRNA pseudouridine(55) synthase TruB [Deltaproteobacteria bacterium]|nr:tRNA pseudouridine(55) synthase TruB [Deltaproteobacteria bacterium]
MKVSEIYGFLPLYKQKGVSSNQEIQALRKRLGLKKVGHTGTLDPLAEGVLPVLVNKATRTMRFFLEYSKSYRFTVQFGISTDTLDITGRVVFKTSRKVAREEIEGILRDFCGEQVQVTPDFSARKYRGRSLYSYARKGISVPKPERMIKIYRLMLTGFDFPFAQFEMDCSSGTYVRKLIEDMCLKLNVSGTMQSLVRTSCGIFNTANTKRQEEMSLSDIVPVQDVFSDYGRFDINDRFFNSASNGSPVLMEDIQEISWGEFRRYFGYSKGEIIGIYRRDGDVFRPEVILFG